MLTCDLSSANLRGDVWRWARIFRRTVGCFAKHWIRILDVMEEVGRWPMFRERGNCESWATPKKRFVKAAKSAVKRRRR